MNRAIDLTGMTYGKLTVIALHQGYSDQAHARLWRCVCSCGQTDVITRGSRLVSGKKKSCGCLIIETRTKHGKAGTPVYNAWLSIKKRCNNPMDKDYKDYGGRGITICERWNSSVEAFYADMGERPAGHSIDRIAVNGNYEPSNCRWATATEQNRNKRNNVIVEYQGKAMVMQDAANAAGISSGLASLRIKRGIPLDRPKNREFRHFSESDKAEVRKLLTDGVRWSEILMRCGVSSPTLSRIKKAMKETT